MVKIPSNDRRWSNEKQDARLLMDAFGDDEEDGKL